MSDPMNLTRRQALMQTLFGAGAIGLRALATGLPAAFLMNPRKALAAGTCLSPTKAQYVIMSTSSNGDPMNSHVPGTYGISGVVHSPDPMMAATSISLSGRSYQAGGAWAQLPQTVLDRTVFWHLMTNTPIHPKEPEVLKLMGAVPTREMLPSLIAKTTAPCLMTVQPQPLSVGGAGPSEALAYDGAALPTIPPLALKDTLLSPTGALGNLDDLRAQTLNAIFPLYKNVATPAQKTFIDSLATSQTQVQGLNQSLLNNLSSITNNTVPAQITAAITMIQMNIAPVISIHIPFGGDNHSDANLANETAETMSGVGYIASLIQQLTTAGLQDKVTFMTLNVFGRTLGSNGGQSAMTGRTHNPNHQVSLTIGKPFKGGVIGSVVPVGNDFGASPIVSSTGAGSASGDIATVDTLGAFAKTTLSAIGGDTSVVSRGKVINAALAP